jgi:hypothetical protein
MNVSTHECIHLMPPLSRPLEFAVDGTIYSASAGSI